VMGRFDQHIPTIRQRKSFPIVVPTKFGVTQLSAPVVEKDILFNQYSWSWLWHAIWDRSCGKAPGECAGCRPRSTRRRQRMFVPSQARFRDRGPHRQSQEEYGSVSQSWPFAGPGLSVW
jgi:hypothetical protein